MTSEQLVAEGPLPAGPAARRAAHRGRARTGLARLEAAGLGHRAARRPVVRPPPAGPAARGQPQPTAAPRRAASVADFVRFLACWQHVADGTQAEGRAGLLVVVEQLQGLEVAAGEWERHVLPARVAGYDPRWLDELCLAGEVAWGRLTPRPEPDLADAGEVDEPGRRPDPGRTAWRHRRRSVARRDGARSTPSPATPLAIVGREDLAWMLAAVRADQSRDRARRRVPRRTSWPPFGQRGVLPVRTGRRGRPAERPRSTRVCGIWWPGAS